MKTQAWGWLVVAVLAAGLNASYHDGGLQWAHQIADNVQHNSMAVLALATGHADRFLTEARYVATPHELTPCRFTEDMAKFERGMARSRARFDAMEARHQVALARVEAHRARIEAEVARVHIPAVAFTPVSIRIPDASACQRIQINVPRAPHITIPAVRSVHVDVQGAGPV